MKTTWLAVLALLGLAFILATDPGDAAEIQRAPENCKNAHAVLGWTNFKDPEDHKRPWRLLGFVMYSKSFWRIVDSYEPGVSQQASFRQYKVKGHENGAAYVASCGHGATCNAIAASFFKVYKFGGVPSVHCGPLPSVLSDPIKPEIYKPTQEELDDWNESGGEDDEDDEEFDFDDEEEDDKKDKDKKEGDKDKDKKDEKKKQKKDDDPSVDDF